MTQTEPVEPYNLLHKRCYLLPKNNRRLPQSITGLFLRGHVFQTNPHVPPYPGHARARHHASLPFRRDTAPGRPPEAHRPPSAVLEDTSHSFATRYTPCVALGINILNSSLFLFSPIKTKLLKAAFQVRKKFRDIEKQREKSMEPGRRSFILL